MQRELTRCRALMLLSCSLLLEPAVVIAQQPAGQIALTGGVATDQRGVRSNAVSFAPSLMLAQSANVAIQIGGNATRFATDAWSLGANASFSGREAAGPFALTLNGGASASRLRDVATTSFTQGELTPAIELQLRRLTLFGGGRGVAGVVSNQGARGGLPIAGSNDATTVNRSGMGPLFGALLSLGNETQRLQLGAREDRLRVDGTGIVDRSAMLSLSEGRVTLGANVGSRVAPDERLSYGGGSISIALGGAASLDAAAGRYASNRVLGTPGGQYLTAGLSFRFGGTPVREPQLPTPSGSGVARIAPGATRLSIRAPAARRVELAGDFNEWKPARATRAANGVWYVDLKIPPGQYRYAFRIDGIEWRVPDGATAVDDGFGGKSAWLTVRDKSTG